MAFQVRWAGRSAFVVVRWAGALAVALFGGWASASAEAGTQLVYEGELTYPQVEHHVATGRVIRISSSPGGSGAAAILLREATAVVIDGECNSACAWALVTTPSACFTARARFGFHAAHDPGTGRRMNGATTYWLDQVRPGLRKHLQPLLESSRVLPVSAAELRTYYPEQYCPNGQPTADMMAISRDYRNRQAMKMQIARIAPADLRATAPAELARAIPAVDLADQRQWPSRVEVAETQPSAHLAATLAVATAEPADDAHIELALDSQHDRPSASGEIAHLIQRGDVSGATSATPADDVVAEAVTDGLLAAQIVDAGRIRVVSAIAAFGAGSEQVVSSAAQWWLDGAGTERIPVPLPPMSGYRLEAGLRPQTPVFSEPPVEQRKTCLTPSDPKRRPPILLFGAAAAPKSEANCVL